MSAALAVTLTGLTATTSMTTAAAAGPVIDMGSASSYAYLAGSALTNGGSAATPTTLLGNAGTDIGLPQGDAFTAAPNSFSGIGVLNLSNEAADRAQKDAKAAYDAITEMTPTIILGELGERTIAPGVYAPGAFDGVSLVANGAAFTTNGSLVLDGGGDANATFVFSTDAALSTSAGAQVSLINGTQACNVYWRVGAAFSTGAGVTFAGHVLANAGATTGEGTTINGQLIALAKPVPGQITTGAAAHIVNNSCIDTPSTVWIDSTLGPVTAGVAYSDSLSVAMSTTPTVVPTNAVYGLAGGTALPSGLTLDYETGAVTGTPTAAGQYAFTIQALAVGANPVTKAFSMGVRVNLGAADPYAILAGLSFTNVGTSTLNGTGGNDIGITTAGTAAYVPGTLVGLGHVTQADAPTADAQAAALSAFNAARAIPNAIPMEAVLTALTLTPGTYQAPSAAGMAANATLTLDGQGDPNAVFVLRVPAAVVIGADAKIILSRGTQAANVFWIVDGAFGVGANAAFSGRVLTSGAVVIGASTTVHGQLISMLAAVTLSGNTITNDSALSTVWIDSTLANATIDAPYADALTAAVSEAPSEVSALATFTVSVGALPVGLTLATNGVLDGTPTVAGSSSFTVSAVISGHAVVTKSFTFTVSPLLVGAWIDDNLSTTATVGVAYSDSLSVGDSTSPTSPSTIAVFTVSVGTPPAGLTLATNGVLEGTPTVAGSFSFTVKALISGHSPITQAFRVVVSSAPATVWIDSTLAANATIGVAYSDEVSAGTVEADGVPAAGTVFETDTGALPSGLVLDSVTGTLKGTPTVAGTFTFGLDATAPTHTAASADFSIVVSSAAVWIDSTLAATATVGAAYSNSLAVGDSTSPTSPSPIAVFTVSAGTPPAGLTLTTNGVLEGTPTAAGSFSFTVQAVISGHSPLTHTFHVVVAAPSSGGPGTAAGASPVPAANPAGVAATASAAPPAVTPVVAISDVGSARAIWRMSKSWKWTVLQAFAIASRNIPMSAVFTVVRSPISGQSRNLAAATRKAKALATASGGHFGGVIPGHLWRGRARIIVNW
jgi:hypothetical protein